MDPLQAALNEIMIQRVYFRQNISNSRISRLLVNTPSPDIRPFLDALRNFERVIVSDLNRNFTEFVKSNLQSFWILKKTLISTEFEFFKDIYTQRLRNLLRVQYNRIVIPIRFNQIIAGLIEGVTRTFTELSKGITFFQSEQQQLRWPVYHRDVSCGTKHLATAQKFVKTKFGPDMAQAISRCYIERLIYNEIFQNELGYQDIPHKIELDDVARHYDKYFPHSNLKVKIRFFHHMPITVDVITNDIIEKYTKTLDVNGNYNDIVFCEKQERFGDKNSYVKFQTFAAETQWN